MLGDAPARALAIYAHPDDPDVSCGGTLARWSGQGAEVHVLIVTTGDREPTTRRSNPGNWRNGVWANRRPRPTCSA